MKNARRIALVLAVAIMSMMSARGQYYQIANQAVDMLGTIFQGGAQYRGMVDASYQRGIGNKRADILEFTTTQGVRYKSWFFMGVGAGVDILYGQQNGFNGTPSNGGTVKDTGCMVPLFSDFRFDIGLGQKTSFFIDLRLGASFLMGKNYVRVGDGYINGSECFYFKPSIGLRFPVSSSNPKLAFKAGASYTLIATDYWYTSTQNITLNSLGLSLGFEW